MHSGTFCSKSKKFRMRNDVGVLPVGWMMCVKYTVLETGKLDTKLLTSLFNARIILIVFYLFIYLSFIHLFVEIIIIIGRLR